MPQKHFKKYDNPEFDGRIKIQKSEHAKIKRFYQSREYSIRGLGRLYNVNKRIIQFIIYPERLKTSNFPGHWAKYYNKEKHKLTMRKYRAKKISLNICHN